MTTFILGMFAGALFTCLLATIVVAIVDVRATYRREQHAAGKARRPVYKGEGS